MPYVTVVFDSEKIAQETVDKLKQWLQPRVANVLSMDEVRSDPAAADDITVTRDEIMVVQHATHPTDVNVPPLEIYIQAGRPKGRDGSKVVTLLGQFLCESGIIPDEYLGVGQAGIFLTFHEFNGFGFIPRSRQQEGDTHAFES